MPSVLIETGFLTNPSEEKFLADTLNQKKMSQAMFTAFESYKNELEGITSSVKPNENPGTNTNPENTSEVNKDKVIFRIQIETSGKRITATSPKFKGLKVFEYEQDNLYKYTVGEYIMDFKSANSYKTQLR